MTDNWYDVGDYYIDFRCEHYQRLSSLDAAKYTVQHILDNYPPPYYLMVSGGVDSQAMLWSWAQHGRDYIPTPVTYVTYNQTLNAEDLETLWDFTERENISVNPQDFDILDFYFSDRYLNIVEQFQCASPQIGVYIGMTQHLPGTVVFSGSLSFIKSIAFDHVQRSLVRYSQTRSVVPFFFWHTPELLYSAHKTSVTHLTSDDQSKALCYESCGFPVISQRKDINPLTGFNGVKEYFDRNYSNQITPKHKLSVAGPSRRAHDLLLRYPHVSRIGHPQYQQYWNT